MCVYIYITYKWDIIICGCVYQKGGQPATSAIRIQSLKSNPSKISMQWRCHAWLMSTLTLPTKQHQRRMAFRPCQTKALAFCFDGQVHEAKPGMPLHAVPNNVHLDIVHNVLQLEFRQLVLGVLIEPLVQEVSLGRLSILVVYIYIYIYMYIYTPSKNSICTCIMYNIYIYIYANPKL